MATLEEASRRALEASQARRDALEPLYTELARCRTSVPPELADRTREEIASLRRSSADLKAARQRTDALSDELSARLHDADKAVNRRWYRLNPPANGAIDLQEREARHFARGMNGYKLGLILFIGSFAGVVIEMLWCLVRYGYIESRAGLVWGPFNLLYGAGAAALSVLLYRYRNRGRWLSFLGGMIIGSAVEYLCHWAMEVVFGSSSWDYSALPFNLGGRICLLYSIFWGVLGVFWIKDLYPRMAKWILRIPDRLGRGLTWALTIFLVVNALVSGMAVLRWSQRLDGVPPRSAWEETMDRRFPDERMERIYANMTFE